MSTSQETGASPFLETHDTFLGPKTAYCSLRNEMKWKSLVCEMKICSLQNENLQFAKWQSVVYKMTIYFLAASTRIF